MAKAITYSSDMLCKSLQQHDIQIKVITVMNTRTVIFRVGSSKALVTIYQTKWFPILENQIFIIWTNCRASHFNFGQVAL
jgi:hypothetical protein